MNTRDQILANLGDVLNRASNGRAKIDQLKENARIIEDVGLSSLDMLELRCELEERWQTTIPDDELIHLQTIGDIISLVERNGK